MGDDVDRAHRTDEQIPDASLSQVFDCFCTSTASLSRSINDFGSLTELVLDSACIHRQEGRM